MTIFELNAALIFDIIKKTVFDINDEVIFVGVLIIV